MGEGRPVNKESLRISECMRENFLSAILDSFRTSFEQMAFLATTEHLTVSSTLTRSAVLERLSHAEESMVCGGKGCYSRTHWIEQNRPPS